MGESFSGTHSWPEAERQRSREILAYLPGTLRASTQRGQVIRNSILLVLRL